MRRGHIASEKLQKQINDFNAQPIVAGDKVFVKGKYLKCSSSRNKEMLEACTVKEVTEDGIVVFNGYHRGDTCLVAKENCSKDTYRVGANPFAEKQWMQRIRTFNMTLESILIKLLKPYFDENEIYDTTKSGKKFKISKLNWNPFILNKYGNKEYYQRDFCWSVKDKQLLIDSIYNQINCGQIIVRKRSWEHMTEEAENGIDEVFEFDIVDGKQRLNAIWGFMNNEFPDSHGNYWNDLSDYARCQFEDSDCITFAEMEEQTTDKDVIKAFLGVNFTGVPMSKEHIDYIREINKKI